VLDYCKSAVVGFFQSISLSTVSSSLQDTLRLLTLWFEYGNLPEVSEALVEGVKAIQIDNWIQVGYSDNIDSSLLHSLNEVIFFSVY